MANKPLAELIAELDELEKESQSHDPYKAIEAREKLIEGLTGYWPRISAELKRGTGVCSQHERCIWEITLGSCKANADTAIKQREQAEIERDRYKREADLLRDALETGLEELCGCESGGGITDLEPGFTCGYCNALAQADKIRRGEDD